MPKNTTNLPIPVRRALRRLGQDIKDARRRRFIPMPLMAERAGISRTTLTNIESGAATVSLGNYARVLFVLGMAERLQNLIINSENPLEQELSDRALPKRIYLPRARLNKDSK